MGTHMVTYTVFAARPDAGTPAQLAKSLSEVPQTYAVVHVQQRDSTSLTAVLDRGANSQRHLSDWGLGKQLAPKPAQIERDEVTVDVKFQVSHIVVRFHLPGLLRESDCWVNVHKLFVFAVLRVGVEAVCM